MCPKGLEQVSKQTSQTDTQHHARLPKGRNTPSVLAWMMDKQRVSPRDGPAFNHGGTKP